MEDYIGARVDYEPKYKDVLTYFQNIGNLYTWEAEVLSINSCVFYRKPL